MITLEQLEAMSEQDIYNFVCKHLLTQNKRACENGYCCYRTTDNLKCAVGCLIPDDVYRPIFENKNILWIRSCLRDLADTNDKDRRFLAFLDNHDSLLGCLQRIHDIYPVSDWRGKLNRLPEILYTLKPYENSP